MSTEDFDYSHLNELEEMLVEAIARKYEEFPQEGWQCSDIPKVGTGTSGGGVILREEDAAPLRNAIRPVVGNIFAPWHDIPSPGVLKNRYLYQVKKAAVPLSGDSVEGVAFDDVVLGTPSLIPDYMARVKTNLTDWQGETVTAFRDTYVRRFNPMFGLQANGVLILQLSMQAYVDIWQKARENIVAILVASIQSFDALNYWGSEAKQKLAFDIATGVAGIAGAIASGPLAAITAAVVGAGLTVAKDPITTQSTESDIEGSTIPEVWSNMRASVRALKDEIVATEAELGDLVSAIRQGYDAKFAVDLGDADTDQQMTGTDLIAPPVPGTMVSDDLDSNNDGKVSVDELADGVERPDAGYRPPNAADSV
ncbi:hypothetical protein FB566_3107 [Stackebrandtia endophytica]|uniref:EF-hand domain-containing protein n=1 Tax=Stackebrandtia endophytica TaxID=1496996 RepID=A0A543AY94_9ACTN|nr:hypothetical protein [Stackebrandtia endophytica]TQL77548.1 hypothetical protein FB566_3107 [Stackebrandtia endophytica]